MFTTIPSMQPHFVLGLFLYLIQIQITAWDLSFFSPMKKASNEHRY